MWTICEKKWALDLYIDHSINIHWIHVEDTETLWNWLLYYQISNIINHIMIWLHSNSSTNKKSRRELENLWRFKQMFPNTILMKVAIIIENRTNFN